MIQFNQLLVHPDNSGIYIDCQVLDQPYFTNVYIDKVIVHTQDTYSPNFSNLTPVFIQTITGNNKSLKLTIDKSQIMIKSMEDKIFFVIIETKGTPASNTPCGLDNKSTIGVTYNDKSIYNQALSYINQAYNECSIPRDFIDFILRYKALQVCIKAQDYSQTIKYWKKFIGSPNVVIPKCNCNG